MRYTLNLILGIMAALFAGCHTQRQRPAPVKYGPFPGPEPQEQRIEPAKPQQADTVPMQPQDTVAPQQELPKEPDMPLCKYGPPGGNW